MTRPRPTLAFQRLIDDPDRVRGLLAGSCYFDATFAEWEHGRRFIAALIPRAGTILDIGCGNGFLLRCLQEWAAQTLEPFGIDTDEDRLRDARELFPNQHQRFIACDAADIAAGIGEAEEAAGFPSHFDTIFWNVWDNARFTDEPIRAILSGLIARLAPGGRAVLGFYLPSTQQNLERVTELTTAGFSPDGIASDPTRDEIAVWFDRHSTTRER